MTTETKDARPEEPVETTTDAPPEVVEVDAATPEPCGDEPLTARIEALLVGTDRPITEARLGALLGLTGRGVAGRVRDAIDELNESYAETGRAFTAERVAAGWQIYTRADFAPLMAGLQRERQHARLSPAALETLAIIAYRTKEGGVIRAEIEAIRGVSCGEVLRGLLERRLIKIVGRREDLGRPMLYGTTKTFLETFGLADLDDLPPVAGASEASLSPMQNATPEGASDATNDEAADEESEPADAVLHEEDPPVDPETTP